jgi:uncharacterized membrane protein YgcG
MWFELAFDLLVLLWPFGRRKPVEPNATEPNATERVELNATEPNASTPRVKHSTTAGIELGRFGWWRHVAAGLVVLGCGGLALAGLVGRESQTEERFEAKQVTVTPTGDNGVTIREVVDQDFGTHDRHGYERTIPNDFGVPTEVRASSPDASDDISVEQIGGATRIRVGDPDVTVRGQHRYVLTYTLADARLSSGVLALDIIGTQEGLPTERFEVVVTGLQLDGPRCHVGADGTVGGCTLAPDGAAYRTEIRPLKPGQGITIGGTITGRTEPVAVAEPPLPARRGGNRALLALATLVVGVAAVAAVYLVARRRGRNEVFAGGAADAAYGPAPAPTSPFSPLGSAVPTAVRLVADERLDELATTEFVPPGGIEPWHSTVLLRERIDNESIGAWFSGLVARDVISLARGSDGDVTLAVGEKFDSAVASERDVLSALFDGRQRIPLGTYDKRFATAWRKVRAVQKDAIAESGWWKRHSPASGVRVGVPWPLLFLAFDLLLFAVVGGWLSTALGEIDTPPVALLLALFAPGLAAIALYRSLLPVRSAPGSAVALRAESFRRFLKASEGRHVEWAWKHGRLREYSAWAVALGAADAWQQAMEGSRVPRAELSTGLLLIHTTGQSWSSTHTAPSSSSSSSSSGGGFSGGSVGDGGGGGSSGSW